MPGWDFQFRLNLGGQKFNLNSNKVVNRRKMGRKK